VSDTIKAIEKEIRKIEKRVTAVKKETPGSKREKHMQEAQLSLLGSVLDDLRKEQKHLAQLEEERIANAGEAPTGKSRT
jgi:hypothetical protein